jgi:ubiquinol-cytochrome c reductase cytochrome c subunit
MRVFRTFGSASLLAFCAMASAQSPPAGDATRGRQHYTDFGCWQCHGTTGAGGGWQGPRLAPRPVAFAAFAYQLRNPRAQMPHYSRKLLSDQDVADIYAYLQSIPAGRPASQIDLLKR